ncbi:MAG: hypothetical protein CSA62_01885 [Planctomycetota bacterium]|nr:MAG: hypothetical protein CSA62_01885 [Planctomycetota bacterium]
MQLPRRSFALLFLLLLAPTFFVGWLGLREIQIFEGQHEEALAGEAQAVLRNAEQRFVSLVDRFLEKTQLALNGRPRHSIKAALERMPRESNALTTAFLLERDGSALFPVLPEDTSWRVLTPQTVFDNLSPEERRNPIVIAAEDKLEKAGSEASLGLDKDAYARLESFDIQSLPAQLAAFACLQRGLLLARLQEDNEALVEFDTGLLYLQNLQDDRLGSTLRLSLQLAEAEIELRQADAGIDEIAGGYARDRARSVLTGILRDFARGAYDRANERLLEGIWQKARKLAGSIAARSRAFASELEALDVRNLERKSRRLSLSRILEQTQLRERIRNTQNPPRFPLTIPLAGNFEAKETALLAVLEIKDASGETLLPGLKLDLEILLAEPMLDLEERLALQGRYEVVLLDENNERLGEALGRTPQESARDQELTERLSPSLRLGPPLLGFSLSAAPRNPTRILAERQRTLVMRGVMLLALAVVAGAGAFLLIRGMRREAELAQLKTSFVGRVSHELKTPLALIRMYGETLAMGRTQEPKKVKHFAGIIARESNRLTALIDNILDFSRIEAGHKGYERNPVELAPILDDCFESYRSHLESQGFELGKELEPELWAELDSGALTQAVINLLSNAHKYSDQSKEIRLELRAVGEQAEIRVLDRGIGVPEAERERVFETFYRASTAGERRGAGLGLALIAHFVEAHGGSTACRAREGGGSIFSFLLPLLPTNKTHAPPCPSRQEASPNPKEHLE